MHIREWPHGYISVDWSSSEKSARYVCKYLLADDKNNAWFSLSKKPALGAAWFARKAETAERFGVLPSSFEYLPPGGTKGRPYPMTGATRRDYLNAITTDIADRPRMSEWVVKTFDKHEKARLQEICDRMSAEEYDALYQASLELEDEGDASKHRREHWSFIDHLEKLLDRSETGILRRVNGKWEPEIGQQKEPENYW